MTTEYTGNKKVLTLMLITVLSCVVLTLITVICYFIVDAILGDKSSDKALLTSRILNSTGAVASNGYLCAKIGKDILNENGKAMDAAIATLICEGVICLQSMGIGGGFIMTIYDAKLGKAEVLNARETAPEAATENMYGTKEELSLKGGLAVAVPSELKGYYEAYKKYGGGVPWKRLFEPSIKICHEGFLVPRYLDEHIQRSKADILNSSSLREFLTNPSTGNFYKEGEKMRNPKLGKFLEVIANEGIGPFYEGEIAKNIVKEIRDEGGILTENDLKNYQVQWMEPVEVTWRNYKMYSSPVPGSGEILALMMNILNNFGSPSPFDPIATQRFLETFKWGYARRTELGDISKENYVPDIKYVKELLKKIQSPEYANDIRKMIKDNETSADPKFYGANVVQADNHGTCHVSVMSANGDAVSATSTINLVFGAKFVSKSLGIIYNNEMSDFSAPDFDNPFGLPPSPANYIKPGKRPLSSMCPTIFVNDKKEVELVIGASGGSRITSTVVTVAFHSLMGNKTAMEAINIPRIHHQLFPMEADFENDFPIKTINAIQEIGHNTTKTDRKRTSTVTAIRRLNGRVTAGFDNRREGSAEV